MAEEEEVLVDRARDRVESLRNMAMCNRQMDDAELLEDLADAVESLRKERKRLLVALDSMKYEFSDRLTEGTDPDSLSDQECYDYLQEQLDKSDVSSPVGLEDL